MCHSNHCHSSLITLGLLHMCTLYPPFVIITQAKKKESVLKNNHRRRAPKNNKPHNHLFSCLLFPAYLSGYGILGITRRGISQNRIESPSGENTKTKQPPAWLRFVMKRTNRYRICRFSSPSSRMFLFSSHFSIPVSYCPYDCFFFFSLSFAPITSISLTSFSSSCKTLRGSRTKKNG